MMKTACVFIFTFVLACGAFVPPPVAENPATKPAPTTCDSGSVKDDLKQMRDKVTEILAILDRIESKQSELTSLTDSYEELTDKYDTLLGAVNKLLSQECKGDSATEPVDQVESICITSCEGRADGDYQSCIGCNVYASCSNGHLTDNRPCPYKIGGGMLVWDDSSLTCKLSSTTCAGGLSPTFPESICITSCEGRDNGDHQSCKNCTVYATCSNGILTDPRPCPAKLVWDDYEGKCLYKSASCFQG